jgi:glutamine cyclotransferase
MTIHRKPLIVVVLLLVLVGLAHSTAPAVAQTQSVETLYPQIIAEYPHDQGAWTQGLLWHNGVLYESTGLNGRSSVRRVDLKTGTVQQIREVNERYFAEGLALVGGHLIQLTWQSKVAFVYDLASFKLLRAFTYPTEGWGLCYDGADLYMSDGTETLYVRDATTFEVKNTLTIKYHDMPITAVVADGRSTRPNELECVDDVVYANLWTSNLIARIDKATGTITAIIDLEDLRQKAVAIFPQTDVTNGIAYNPDTDTFYVTGKLWPRVYEVKFGPTQG